jgi:hypothetical protein
VSLAYDPALRLYETVGAGGAASATTRFGYDGSDLTALHNSTFYQNFYPVLTITAR